MKKTLPANVLIICFIACCLHTSSIVQAQIPANGLVAHWPFSGNVNDIGPYNIPTVAHNVSPTTGKNGSPGTAYLFNSGDSYVNTSYHSKTNMDSAMTICAIFQPAAFHNGDCQRNTILIRGYWNSNGGYRLDFDDDAYNTCQVIDTNQMVMVASMGLMQLTDFSRFKSSSKIHTGKWYCIVSTMKNGTLKIYTDGMLTHTSTGWPTFLGASSDSIYIGQHVLGQPGIPYNFTGSIDDIALYNRALTTAEIDSYCTNAPQVHVTVPKHNQIHESITLYPNPNNGKFTIQGTLNSETAQLNVYNMVGTVIHRSNVPVKGVLVSESIDISAFPAGLYMIKITAGDYTENIRFVKNE